MPITCNGFCFAYTIQSFRPELGLLVDYFVQDDEQDYYESRRSRRHIEEEEARAEKRIMNAKKVL